MVREPFQEGQRWISEAEPDLGLGTVLQASGDRVSVLFPATGQMRQYARDHAPLRRVRFRRGDRIESHDGRALTVTRVRDEEGLLVYEGDEGELPEAQLGDRLSVHGPEERLLSGRVDEPDDFDLRRRAWEQESGRRCSPVRGFVGGRIDLIPHQLYIAREVSGRHAPRVLLSDEVGLGKTIEAGLILHRLLRTGRVSRVLILVPESLVHQWFVEMLRRFNLWMNIFDESRCGAIEGNPFLDDQLVLCGLEFLAASPIRTQQAVEAGWDLLVVDEAHHLEWSPDLPGPEYKLVEALGREAVGLLLLTATPEQVGPESHFARLRLLDPDRYTDWDAFNRESASYRGVARIATKLREGRPLSRADLQRLAAFPELRHRRPMLEAAGRGGEAERRELLEWLLDLHGPGRVVFRNARGVVQGFPLRHVHLVPLEGGRDHGEWVDRVSTEFAVDAGDAALEARLQLNDDPRVNWLVDLLRELAPQKVLLICRSVAKVTALEEALRRKINLGIGLFHEELTLLQRDRQAAWFADENGCRLLLCSEIGSEGRNFQFARHLVLFDLPLNPELLEQRIGRLDRIGQQHDIEIHVPFLRGSPQEALTRWYHEGLDAFESHLEGGNILFRRFGRQMHDLALEYPVSEDAAGELAALVRETSRERKALARRLEEGRDRLLELNSYRPEEARAVIDAIRQADRDDALEEFMLDVFEHFGVQVEALAPRTYALNPVGVTTEAFPAIPEEGMVATFDRERAVSRDEVGFLTLDHPMIMGAIDLLLGQETGNSAFALWPGAPRRGLLLETLFILEPIAEASLHADRFLPPTALRVVVDESAMDVTADHPPDRLRPCLRPGRPHELLDEEGMTRALLPRLLEAAREVARKGAEDRLGESLQRVRELLGHERRRLEALQEVNPHVRPEEVESLRQEQEALETVIRKSRLRLDALRLVWLR